MLNPIIIHQRVNEDGAIVIDAEKNDLQHQDYLLNRLHLCISHSEGRYFVTGNYSKSTGYTQEIAFDISAGRDLRAIRGDFGLYLHGRPWDDSTVISTIQDSIIASLTLVNQNGLNVNTLDQT